jgi:hypothetical protein
MALRTLVPSRSYIFRQRLRPSTFGVPTLPIGRLTATMRPNGSLNADVPHAGAAPGQRAAG